MWHYYLNFFQVNNVCLHVSASDHYQWAMTRSKSQRFSRRKLKNSLCWGIHQIDMARDAVMLFDSLACGRLFLQKVLPKSHDGLALALVLYGWR